MGCPLHNMRDQNVNGYHTEYRTFKVEPSTMEEWQKTTTVIMWLHVEDHKMTLFVNKVLGLQL